MYMLIFLFLEFKDNIEGIEMILFSEYNQRNILKINVSFGRVLSRIYNVKSDKYQLFMIISCGYI